ncbi:ABC transporter substrate-binding protein [Nocardioides sp. YIM 152315]|uniref:ABC transporter substrate-binding protein n=1 Tax=Nocardioides sp. YIM 152315 TaxID=3031760 RepID=UPI0023DCEABE|nr:ABC transporter substrate-binding protein [Nocardioides sp. YIM 152315]MDF1602903.1 ABC transporter substrate-binding protein [Nocardioides sp. YIM 152315]
MLRSPDPSRRRLLAATVAVAAGALLAACGGDEGGGDTAAEGSATPSQGPWSYTDDLGQTIELDETPTRIAAYGDAGAALWNFGVTPVALFHYMDPADDPTFEDLDLSETEVIGTAYGEINLEELAALQPDLIVTTTFDGDTADEMYGFKDEAQLAKIKEIAPVVGIEQSGSALDVVATNEELAASLGVDTGEGSDVAEDRAEFEAASAELTEAASSGLTVLPMYAEDAGLYVLIPQDDPMMSYFQDLGVQFEKTGGKDDYYWETLSWENAGKYDADLVLNSQRGSYSTEQLEEQPVFGKLAAVEAGQIHPWKYKAMDYVSLTSYMDELTGWLETDEDVAS